MADLAVLQVKFTADTSAMDRAFDAAERRAKAFQATFKGINPQLDLDTKGFMSGLEAATAASSRAADSIERDINRARAAAAAPIKVNVEATGTDTTISELTGVNRAREQVDGKNASVNVKATGTTETASELGIVDKLVGALNGKNAAVNIKASGAAETNAELGIVERMVNHLNGQKAKVDVDASSAKAVPQIMGDATSSVKNFQVVAALIAASTMPLMLGAIGGLAGAAASAAAGVGGLAMAIGTGLVGAGAAAVGTFAALGAGAYAAGGLIANAAANAFGAEKGFASLGAEVKAAGDQVKTANELIAKMPAGTDAAAAAQERLRISQEYQAAATQNQVDWFNKYGAASNLLVSDVDNLRLGFTSLVADMSGQLIPTMTDFVEVGTTMLPMLEGPLQAIVDGTNEAAGGFLEMLASGQSLQALQNVFDLVGDSAGAAINIISDGFIVALYAAQPLIPVISQVELVLSSAATAAAVWVQTAEGQSRIADIWGVLFDYGGRLVQVVEDLGMGFYNLGASIAQAGMVDQMMSGLEAAVGKFHELTKAGTESRSVLDNFMAISGPILTAMGGLVGAVAQGFLDLTNGIVTATDASTGMNILEEIFTKLQDVVPVVVDMLVQSFQDIGPLIPDLVLNLAELANTFLTATPQLLVFLETLNGAMSLFNELPSGVQTAIAQFAAFAFLITGTGIPALAGMASNIAIVYKVFGGFGVVTAAQAVISGIGSAFGLAATTVSGLASALGVTLPMLGALAALGAIAILIALTFDMSAAKDAYNTAKEEGKGTGEAFTDAFVAGMQGVPILGSVVSWIDENVAKPIDEWFTSFTPSTSIWDVITGKGEAQDNTILSTLMGWWDAVTTWLSGLVPDVNLMDVIAGAADATGLTGLLTTVQGAIQPVIDWVSGAWETVKSTAEAAWSALGPIISLAGQSIVAAAGIMLGMVLVPILAGWEQVKALTQIAWDAIGLIISGAIALWSSVISPALAALGVVFSAAWTVIQTGAQVAWDAIGTVISTAITLWQTYVQPVIDALVSFIGTEWTMIQTQAQAAWDAIGQVISTAVGLWQTYVQPVIDAIVSVVQTAWSTVQSVTETVWNTLGTIIQTAVSLWQTYIQPVIDAIVSVVQTAWDTISTATQTAWDAIGSVISTAVGAWEGYIQPVLDAIISAVQTAWDTISSAATEAWNAIGQVVLDNWDTITTGVTAATEALPGIIQAAWDAITGAVSDFASSFGDAVKDAFGKGLQAGLNIIADFIDAIKSALDTIGVDIGIDLGSASGALRGATGYAEGGLAFAQGGKGGMGTHNPAPRMHIWNEQQGPEAYIAKNGPRENQLAYLQTAASWFNRALVPADPAKTGTMKKGLHNKHALGGLEGVRAFCSGGCTHAAGGYVDDKCNCAEKATPVAMFYCGGREWDPAVAQIVEKVEGQTGTVANTYEGHPGGQGYSSDFWGGSGCPTWVGGGGDAVQSLVEGELSNMVSYYIWQGTLHGFGGTQNYCAEDPNDCHYDHIHVTWGGGGGGFKPCINLREIARKAIDAIKPTVDMGTGPVFDAVDSFANDQMIQKAEDYILSLIPTCGGSGGGGGGGSCNDAVQPAMEQLGMPSSYEQPTRDIIQRESGDNPTIQNTEGSGATGCMQFMPDTFAHYCAQTGCCDINDPLCNVQAGLLFQKDNGGPGNFFRLGGTVGKYKNGGVIPGQPGEDLLVVAEPGEAIIPTNAVGAFQDLATAISTTGGLVGGGPVGGGAAPGEDPATKAIVQATLDQTNALITTDTSTTGQVVNTIMQQTGLNVQNAAALLAQIMDQTVQLLADAGVQTTTLLTGVTEQTTAQTTALGEHLTTLGDTTSTKLDEASTTITTGFTDGLTAFSGEMLPPIQEIPTAIETHMGGVSTGVQDLVGVEKQAWGLATGGKVGAGHKPVRLYGEGAGNEWFITDALGVRNKNTGLLHDAAHALGYGVYPAHEGGTGDGGGWDLVGSSGKVMTIGAGVSGHITDAMNAWNDVQSVKLLPHYGSSPNVSVSLGDPGDGAIGVTYSTGQIILDPNWLGGDQGMALAAHEFGHALGLGHVDDPSSLMNPYLSPGVTGITGDSSAAVQGLWGAFGATPRVPASFHRGGYVGGDGFGLLEKGERVLSRHQTSLLEESLQGPGGGIVNEGDTIINLGDIVINGANTGDAQAIADKVRSEQQKMLEESLLRLADRGNSMRTQTSAGWS